MEEKQENTKRINKNYIKWSRLKRRVLKNTWLVRIVGLVMFIGLVFFTFSSLGRFFGNSKVSDYYVYAKNFIFTPKDSVLTSLGRTNILILGKGGAGHDAPDLTDTIIFSSISHKKDDLILVSLPRDIWVSEIRAKLNSAYFWGNQKENGGGLILSKAVVEKIVGKPVHYAVVVDFSGFKELIDTLGGVNVMVENSFVDEKFPISGKENDECNGDLEYECRYETVKFESGSQIMDGETALKFARSRNAKGDEGTDLARAKRQQKIIEAIKNKLLSWEVISSPKKLADALAVLRKNTETDITDSVGAVLARRIFQTRDQMISSSIPDGFLLNPPISKKYDNLYVFVPVTETWKEFNEWIEGLLD